MRSSGLTSFALFLFALCGLVAFASTPSLAAPGDASPDAAWREISEPVALKTVAAEQAPRPLAYRSFELDSELLRRVLTVAPKSRSGAQSSAIISLPRPDGTYERYRIEESSILSAELEARYPDIRTYRAQGVDDPTATGRFDLTMHGFRAFVRSGEGTLIVDPYVLGNDEYYMSFWMADAQTATPDWACLVDEEPGEFVRSLNKAIPLSGDDLTTYRLALTLTGEYVAFFGSIAAAEADAITTINRVNSIYEIDIAVRFNLTAFNSYPDAGTDPFPTGFTVDGNLINQNHADLIANVGSANFDIGHIFTTPGGGGLAQLNSTCSASGKGRAGSGIGIPFGDPFAVNIVSHEMGHQMGALHTFNGTSGSCFSNRSASAAYEPGSGSTIMSYAGICAGENVTNNSQPNFHVKSLEQMISHRDAAGCGSVTATGNTPPIANAGNNFSVPRETPFVLTGSGTDSDGTGTLSYSWEQYNLGAASPPTDYVNGPLIRARNPKTTGARTVPDELFVLNPGLLNNWELLPNVDRSLAFRLVVRDNALGGGGVDDDEMFVFVSGAPFRVTAPNGGESYLANSTATVTWDVGGSTATDVRIRFSDDDGATWSTVEASTPNDGSHDVVMPCAATAEGRIRVEPVGGIYFDVSNNGFSVTQSAPVVNGGVNFASNQPACSFTGNIGATIVDDDPGASLTVDVTATAISGAATVSTPSFGTSPFGTDDLLLIGSVVVSEITSSPVQVEITITASDPCGLLTESSQIFVFNDTTDPVVSCPAELTVQATSPAGIDKADAALTAFFAGASATDNCVDPIAVSDDAPTTIPVGTNPITFSATDGAGNVGTCQVNLIVDPADDTTPILTDVTALRGIYPNPFNPRATIVFSLKGQQRATVEIYNQQGQRVRRLFSGVKPAGTHELEWSGRDDAGQSVASGMYIFKLSTAEGTFTRPAALIK